MKICPEFIEEHDPILFSKIGSRKMRLEEEIEVFEVTVPRGYITDGGSIPRFAWMIDSPFTDGMLAYLVHDYRYTDIQNKDFKRSQADKELYRNLEVCGLNWVRRTLIYIAVSCFGWQFWNRNRNKTLKPGAIKRKK